MTQGNIIFLHGASSSGKTTLARALQDSLPEPFWHISIDKLRDAGVLPTARFKRDDFAWSEHRNRFFDGFHRSLVAYASANNNLIVEHIIEDYSWRPRLAKMFAPFDIFFVKVDCPLHILIEREAARGDRKMGSARADFDTIHEGLEYDFEVHGTRPVADNTAAIIEAWQGRTGRSAFYQLANT